MVATFDLTRNPFYLLGASIRDRREAIAEAFDTALADGRADEATLIRAQQQLLNLRPRLEAELSWLLGLAPARTRVIMDALENGVSEGALVALLEINGLDKANLAADLCCRGDDGDLYVDDLLDAYSEIDPDEILEAVAAGRSVSRFPAPDKQHVEQALAALKLTHAKAALACIVATADPGVEMTRIVEDYLDHGDDRVEHMLGLIVREYDAWSEPRLRPIRETIEASIRAYRAEGGTIPVDTIVRQLAEWDRINQPVQLLEEAKGHEEPRSREIYLAVRDFCVWLANEKDHYDEALAISRALLETFPELPAVADQLLKDVEALEELAGEAKTKKLLEPLLDVREKASKNLAELDHDLASSGFSRRSHGLARKLHDVFAEAAAKAAGTEMADAPWMIVRGLAIDLNNERESPEAAQELINGLMGHTATKPSENVKQRLRADRLTIERNAKWSDLKRAGGNIAKSLTLVSDLLNGADEDERVALMQLKGALESKRSARTRTRVLWLAGIAAFVGFFIYETNKPQTQYRGMSTPQSGQAYVSPSSAPATRTPDFSEEAPAPGRDRVLGKSEIRYCVFQAQRLESLRGMISTYSEWEVNRFNALIEDLNARCSSYRYRPGVLQSVQGEVPTMSPRLYQDAQRLLSSIRGVR